MSTERKVKRAVDAVVSPIQDLIRIESTSGIVLIGAALAAFAWANSPWAAGYERLLDVPVGLRLGDWGLEKPLLLWVNDLLMAVFFFLVGLEIKRELIVGELKSRRQATLPIAAALGGMIVPALIFLALNAGTTGAIGWAVPMATDIAFALGILALLGDRVPLQVKVFLLALAIVDDLGAIVVVAVFYTSSLDVTSLGLAGLVWAVALAYGRLGPARPLIFALLGALLWYFTLKSGIHPTIAGVLLALAVPLRHGISAAELRAGVEPVMTADGEFEESEVAIEHLEELLDDAHSPLHSMEHALGPIVAFGIMPTFAFFNAGVAIGSGVDDPFGPVALGVVLGLVVGKPVGVLVLSWLAVRAGLTDLPDGASWPLLAGVGVLAGIGFTMSLFIGGLAFAGSDLLGSAKIAILGASVVAAAAGYVILRTVLANGTSSTRPDGT